MKQIVSFGHTSVTTHLTRSAIGSGTVRMASMNWTVRRCSSTLKSKKLSNATKLNTIASSSSTIEPMWTWLVSISIERAMEWSTVLERQMNVSQACARRSIRSITDAASTAWTAVFASQQNKCAIAWLTVHSKMMSWFVRGCITAMRVDSTARIYHRNR